MTTEPFPAEFLAKVAANALDIETTLDKYKTQRCLGGPIYRSEQMASNPRYKVATVKARMKLHRLAMGDFTVDDFLESSDDEELALLTKIGPTDKV